MTTRKEEIRKLREEGYTIRQIADKFGTVPSNIHHHLANLDLRKTLLYELKTIVRNQNKEIIQLRRTNKAMTARLKKMAEVIKKL